MFEDIHELQLVKFIMCNKSYTKLIENGAQFCLVQC